MGMLKEVTRTSQPSMVTFSLAFTACERSSAWRWALELLQAANASDADGARSAAVRALKGQWQAAAALSGGHDVVTYSSCATAYGLASEWSLSLGLLDVAARMAVQGDVVFWCSAVSSKWQGSIGLFERMEQLELQSDAVLASTAINAYGQAALWKSACDTLREVCKRRLQANTYVYSNLISICGRELNWHRALSLIKDMGSLKFELALVPYTAAITACASAKQWQEALNLLAALGDGVDEMAYSPVIAACGWEHALHLMLLMKTRNLQQNQVTLNAALHACEKSGRWAEALVLLQSFSPARLERDILSFNSALAACAGNLQWDQVLVLLYALESSGLQGNALTHGILAGCDLPSLGSLEALQSAGLQQMAKVFAKYGLVDKVHLIHGRSKNYRSCAYVEYRNLEDADVALQTLHQRYCLRRGDQPIYVDWANDGRRVSPY
ncbi:unnamed protein product [Effrenium voratum]|nr:unnamed protein product [Effrenium voratum]